MRSRTSGLAHQTFCGFLGQTTIQKRRTQRAVGAGARQSRQGNFAGAPQRDDRQQADQPRRFACRGRRITWREFNSLRLIWRGITPGSERGDAGAAVCRRVDGQFPRRQIVTVWLNGALGEHSPIFHGNGSQRCKARARRILWGNCGREHALVRAIIGRWAGQASDVSRFSHVYFPSQCDAGATPALSALKAQR